MATSKISITYEEGPQGPITKKLKPQDITPKVLAKRFNLEEKSICLIGDGDVYEQNSGKFLNSEGQKLPTDVSEIEIVGEQCKIVAVPVQFSRNEIRALVNEVAEGTTVMKEQINGLSSAPTAVGLLRVLTIMAACTKDPSLVNDKTSTSDFKFNRLKTPKSFRASLVQVINEVTNALLEADKGMTKIRSNMADVPGLLSGSMDAITHPDVPGVETALKLNKERIATVSKLCSDESTKIVTKCDGALETIQELQQAAQATQTHSDEELSRVLKEKKEKEQEEIAMKENQRRLMLQIKKQQKILEDALADYKEKSENLGNLGKLAIACLTDVTLEAAKTVIHATKDLAGGVVDSAKNITGGFADSAMNLGNIALRTLTGEEEFATIHKRKMAKSYEKAFLNFLAGYFSEELDPIESIEEKRESLRGSFEPFIKIAAVTEHGKIVETAAKNFLKQLEITNSLDTASYNKLKVRHGELKVAAQIAMQKKEEKEAANVDKAKIAAGLMDSMTKAAEQSRASYVYERDKEENMLEKESETRMLLAKMTADLQNLDLEKAELNDIIKYLSQGLTLLGSVKSSWIQIKQFFDSVEVVVNGPMTSNFDQFLKLSNSKDANTDYIKKQLLQNAMKACGICYQVSGCAVLYKEVSQKYVIPDIAKVTKNLQLDKESAQKLLPAIQADFTDRENELKEFINEKKKELFEKAQQQIELYSAPLQIAIEDTENEENEEE